MFTWFQIGSIMVFIFIFSYILAYGFLMAPYAVTEKIKFGDASMQQCIHTFCRLDCKFGDYNFIYFMCPKGMIEDGS